METLESLKNIFIFSGLKEQQLKALLEKLNVEKLTKGDVLFWEEDEPEYLYLLVDGKVKVTKQSESGKETILGIIGPGESIGEIAIFDGRVYPFSAQAMEPSTVMKMPRGEFIQFLISNPNACIEVIIELSRRLREAQGVIKGMAADRVEHRIIELLLKLSEKVGRHEEAGLRIGIILTRQDIADMVGSTVETTIRILSRLTKKGLLETRGKSIILKNEKALKDLISLEADW